MWTREIKFPPQRKIHCNRRVCTHHSASGFTVQVPNSSYIMLDPGFADTMQLCQDKNCGAQHVAVAREKGKALPARLRLCKYHKNIFRATQKEVKPLQEKSDLPLLDLVLVRICHVSPMYLPMEPPRVSFCLTSTDLTHKELCFTPIGGACPVARFQAGNREGVQKAGVRERGKGMAALMYSSCVQLESCGYRKADNFCKIPKRTIWQTRCCCSAELHKSLRCIDKKEQEWVTLHLNHVGQEFWQRVTGFIANGLFPNGLVYSQSKPANAMLMAPIQAVAVADALYLSSSSM